MKRKEWLVLLAQQDAESIEALAWAIDDIDLGGKEAAEAGADRLKGVICRIRYGEADADHTKVEEKHLPEGLTQHIMSVCYGCDRFKEDPQHPGCCSSWEDHDEYDACAWLN